WQALAAVKQHDGLHEHPEVRPLRRPHGAIDRKEQPDRRSEEFEIARILAITCRTILARNPNGPVELGTDFAAPGIIRLLERLRIDLVSGPLAARVRRRMRADAGLEVFQWRAGERMDPPRLQIAAGRRAGRGT